MFASQQPPVPLVPHFMVKSKIPVDAGQPSQATYRKFDVPATDSFRSFQEERVLHEFKEAVVELWPGPGKLSSTNGQGLSNEDIAARNNPVKTFEMPDGWNQVFGIERFKVGEALYDEKAAYVDSEHPAPTKDQTIPDLIAASLGALDQEVRPQLLNNVLIVGAASFQKGLLRRFDTEIKHMFPGPNVRLTAPSNYYDRSYASWVGGSILASLGSFHQASFDRYGIHTNTFQLWISRSEYEEHGPSIIEKRSK
jgi:actin-related protein 4